MAAKGRLRIGELSRRVGVTPELLRAWETRYGVIRPERTSGGLRLYSEQDEERVRRMQAHIAAGLSAAEAARLSVPAPAAPAEAASLADIEAELRAGLQAMDETAAQEVLDRLFLTVAADAALSGVILPFLRELGERWASGEASVAEEHFASTVIGARLRALSRGWGQGIGPLALLACPPGERHDLGLLCFGLALRSRGWRIAYLGADTPLDDLASAVQRLAPEAVVTASVDPDRYVAARDELTALSGRTRLIVGGAGATEALASDLGAELLPGDAVGAASALEPAAA